VCCDGEGARVLQARSSDQRRAIEVARAVPLFQA
jgi:hypothetical protein